MATSEMEGHRT